jgi:hypothetical protein
LYEREPNRIKVALAKDTSVKFSSLVRYVPSGILFARMKVKGKLIRRSLKSKSISVGKLRLSDLEKQERQMGFKMQRFIETWL